MHKMFRVCGLRMKQNISKYHINESIHDIVSYMCVDMYIDVSLTYKLYTVNAYHVESLPPTLQQLSLVELLAGQLWPDRPNMEVNREQICCLLVLNNLDSVSYMDEITQQTQCLHSATTLVWWFDCLYPANQFTSICFTAFKLRMDISGCASRPQSTKLKIPPPETQEISYSPAFKRTGVSLRRPSSTKLFAKPTSAMATENQNRRDYNREICEGGRGWP